MNYQIFGVLLVILGVVLSHDVRAENWAPTGVKGMEYDRDRVVKSNKSSDVFSMWFRRNDRDRVAGERVIGVLFNSEVDCYEKELRAISTWWILEDRSLRKTDYFAKRESFGELEKFFASTLCKQSNDFYSTPMGRSDDPRWYEFWKR